MEYVRVLVKLKGIDGNIMTSRFGLSNLHKMFLAFRGEGIFNIISNFNFKR